ncbi:MAG: T9SS type A sorting domain-containing protein, partial [Bacteroidia bacterium]|nr:T9SS type A sorting domain-containing protein [Bacteroidia bacterium]
SLVLNFIVEGNTNEFFDVWAGEEYVGFYRYDDLPVYISNFYPRDTEYDLIRICDNDNEDCCAIHEFRGPDCGEEEECRIFEVFAEAHECNDDGGFFVDIEFDYHNVGDEGFSIRGNGEVYGDDFEYGETFYTIGPLIGDCETIYEFVIIDNQFDDCGGEFVFEEEICCGDMMACEIRDIEIDSMSCNDDGSYSLVLNFIVEGNTNEFFDVWAGEEYVGFYRYDELPVYISNFYPRDAEYDLIRICDNDNDYCCTIHEFLGPNCEEDNECAIENLTVINTECVESEFYLLVDLDYNEAFDESEVVLFGNGTNYGAYELSEFPIALGIFDYLNDSLNEMVAYHEASNCEIFTEFEVECDDFVDSVNESKLSYLNVFSDGQILNVISKNSNNYKVQIYDISGKMVSHSTSNVSLKMNTNYLSSGIYVVKIVDMQSGHYSAQLLSLGY